MTISSLHRSCFLNKHYLFANLISPGDWINNEFRILSVVCVSVCISRMTILDVICKFICIAQIHFWWWWCKFLLKKTPKITKHLHKNNNKKTVDKHSTNMNSNWTKSLSPPTFHPTRFHVTHIFAILASTTSGKRRFISLLVWLQWVVCVCVCDYIYIYFLRSN